MGMSQAWSDHRSWNRKLQDIRMLLGTRPYEFMKVSTDLSKKCSHGVGSFGLTRWPHLRWPGRELQEICLKDVEYGMPKTVLLSSDIIYFPRKPLSEGPSSGWGHSLTADYYVYRFVNIPALILWEIFPFCLGVVEHDSASVIMLILYLLTSSLLTMWRHQRIIWQSTSANCKADDATKELLVANV